MRGLRSWWTLRSSVANVGVHRGVTTIELACSVAATALVTALGVSVYRTHKVRSQVAVSVEFALPAKRLVVASFEATGTPPLDSSVAGVGPLLYGSPPDTYAESLEIHDGRIDLRFGEHADSAIAGKMLSLTPFTTADGQIVWLCGNDVPGVGLSPLGFLTSGSRAVQVESAIERRYLPRSCR